MHAGHVQRGLHQLTDTRLPIPAGEFRICLFGGASDGKEHLAIVMGDVYEQRDVLVRIHSECFTGDVLGSLRCDCGEQLARALHLIGEEGIGVVVYLRQEGRGIGLLNKLRAYDLQDQGYDTVEANVLLGHEPDERDYSIGAEILEALAVRSIRLMTNNPLKMAALSTHNIEVSSRVPLEVSMNPDNIAYLMTKAIKMNHLLSFTGAQGETGQQEHDAAVALRFSPGSLPRNETLQQRPSVTLSYAQSLDGSIAARHGEPLALSGEESLRMTHRLRASHDAILVGIGTVLADDPQLTVRLVEGRDPQPVVVDSHLRMPVEANLFKCGRKCPWIFTTQAAPEDRQLALESAGARIIRVHATEDGQVDLSALLRELDDSGIRNVMVEGGSRIITEFFRQRLVDQVVVTVTPQLVGGVRALDGRSRPMQFSYPRLSNIRHQRLGEDLVIWGVPVWDA